ADVNFTFSAGPASACVLATPAAYTFNAGNYTSPFAITVNGVDDVLTDGSETCTITLSKTSTAPGYDVLADPANQTVTVTDDEAVGYNITGPTPPVMPESGGSSLITLALPSAPNADVNFTFSAGPASACTLATPATYTFNAGNYSTPFLIIVNAVEDPLSNGNTTCTVTMIKTTTAAGYSSLADPAPIDIIVGDTTFLPPPPPVPFAEDMNFGDSPAARTGVPSSLVDAINVRVIVEDGAYVYWNGGQLYGPEHIGNQGVVDLGILQAVDIFSSTLGYFEGGFVICLKGEGEMIWMAGNGTPRQAEWVQTYTVPEFAGYTCLTIFEPGTLALVEKTPQ
ncbi:MAG: hypothetical protein KJ065_27970, partial [Anaerolineae bacterium]|nr:hypothetical protein [Anaerolineae bacterium]